MCEPKKEADHQLELVSAFLAGEQIWANYYSSLRDKIAGLNVAVLGFTFATFDKLAKFEDAYFGFLIVVGVISFVACLRAGIARDFHFRNYEDTVVQIKTAEISLETVIKDSRAKYEVSKSSLSFWTLGASRMPTYVFWAVVIGGICPIVGFAIFVPWDQPVFVTSSDGWSLH